MDKERIDEIVDEVNATFSIEGMTLTDENIETIRACLSGEKEFEETIKALVDKYTVRR